MTATAAPSDGRPALGRRGRLVLSALIVSLAAGLAVALVALPGVALVGLTAKGSADSFLSLPTVLKTGPLPQASKVVDARGNVIATLRGDEDREVVPLSRVPKAMQQAIIDIEDSRFYDHHGIDFRGIARAAVNDQSSGETQGASTLTQQYIKNLLLYTATTKAEQNAATEQTFQRKLKEARYALALEKQVPKSKILEDYLNIAYFGDGAYGIQAAANHYFSVDVSKLNLVQAATLAGLVKNPTAFDPLRHPQAGKDRRDTVLDRMHQLKHLSDAELKYATASGLGLKASRPSQDSCQDSSAPFFCQYVRARLLADPKFGSTQAARSRLLYEGGLTIKTSLDPTMQAAAQGAVDTVVPRGSRVAAGTVLMQPGTGRVLGMAINRLYGASSDGKSAQQTTDFVHTKNNMTTNYSTFSPGSTFKLFTLAAAIDQGLPLDTTFNSPPCYRPPDGVFDLPEGDCFHNAEDGEGGVFSMTTATWGSVNTYFIQLEQKVGVLNAAAMAKRLGVTSPLIDPAKNSNLTSKAGSFTLGAYTASTVDMATAYATIAAHGKHCDPTPVLGIQQGTKQLAYSKPAPCRQAISAKTADTVTSVLEGVLANPAGTGYGGGIDRPAAGKTGTAEGHSDAWFVGYVPQVAAAVTVGDPRSTVDNPLLNVQIGDRYYGSVFGADSPMQIWTQEMRNALNGQPVVPLPAADNTQPKQTLAKVPGVGGKRIDEATRLLQAAGFKVTYVPRADKRAAGIVLLQAPANNAMAPVGSTVTLTVSTGPGKTAPPGFQLPGAGGTTPVQGANPPTTTVPGQ